METQEQLATASTQDRVKETSMTPKKDFELEAKIEDVRNMSIVLETIMDDLWRQKDETRKIDGYEFFTFTDDQVSSTQFAVAQIGNMARELSDFFHSIDERD
jgi:hypothetical protein